MKTENIKFMEIKNDLEKINLNYIFLLDYFNLYDLKEINETYLKNEFNNYYEIAGKYKYNFHYLNKWNLLKNYKSLRDYLIKIYNEIGKKENKF